MSWSYEESSLLKVDVPDIKLTHPSMITVLHANSEMNLSNLLYYFLSGTFCNQIQNVFLKSIVELIRDQSNDSPGFLENIWDSQHEDVSVYSEYSTMDGRIDLLIVYDGRFQYEKCALIIENKLYHEPNNDFDEYYYSVCESENIAPENIWTVLLCLKDDTLSVPKNLKFSTIYHDQLKEKVKTNIDESEYDDLKGIPETKLLLSEYYSHIDDLFEVNIAKDEFWIRFFLDNRKEINSIINHNKPEESLTRDIKKKIDSLENLRNSVRDLFLRRKKNYLRLTNRLVQGPGQYFRGEQYSFKIIRYRLDIDDYFLGSQNHVVLHVYLNIDEINRSQINLDTEEFHQVFKSLGVKIPMQSANDNWFEIKQTKLEMDNTLFFVVQTEIADKWLKLEQLVGNCKRGYLISSVRNKVTTYLTNRGNYLSGLTLDDKNSVIISQYTTTAPFFCYYIYFNPPDRIEVFFYLASCYWDDFFKSIKIPDYFLKLHEKHSARFDEYVDKESYHYYPVLKKSFIIKLDDLKNLDEVLEVERDLWLGMERKVLKMIK